MTREEYCSKIGEAIKAIDFPGEYLGHVWYGSGHINDTFLIRFSEKEESKKYILQRMNHEILKQPGQLMENICNITSFLREKIAKAGGDVNRETLNVIYTKEGAALFRDSIGSYWRAYQFVEDAISYDQVSKPEDFYESAVAFGHFQYMLKDFPAGRLYETIPDFHNTLLRFRVFQKAIAGDLQGRVSEVKEEIDFLLRRELSMGVCAELRAEGKLPLRVTHNDTKMNNVLIDNATGKGICVIDLDTVMPGLSVFDFGDSIRFGANTAMEDEIDLSKVSLDLELFEVYTKGFLEGCRGSLVPGEIEQLPAGAVIMTLECGMRFLTDYLQGDHYFRIHREKHNLDRCRTQLALAADMEQKMDEMKRIVNKYR